MFKFITIIISLLSITYSNIDIQTLQKTFNEDVLYIGAYKKRYNLYLRKKCDEDINCYKKIISKLNEWKQIQEDKKLHRFIDESIHLQEFDPFYFNDIIKKIDQKTAKHNIVLDRSQFLVSIDLGEQLLIVLFWDNENKKYEYIGRDYISSGNIFREKEITLGEDHYYKTPQGVFQSKVGWRSDGKVNKDKRTLGYGYNDRFIFYFGKQKSIRFNVFDKNGTKIKDSTKWPLITGELEFALHSHKSKKGFGRPYSHGCVRMSDDLNRFLDNNMILHKNMLEKNIWKAHYTKEPEIQNYKEYAGEYLFIFDKI